MAHVLAREDGRSATVFPAASRTVSCPSVSPAYTGAATLSASATSFVRPFASVFSTSRVFSLVSTGCTVPHAERHRYGRQHLVGRDGHERPGRKAVVEQALGVGEALVARLALEHDRDELHAVFSAVALRQ